MNGTNMHTKIGRGLSRFRESERGTQLAELAIVLPVLLALFAATAEFGRYFYTYTTLAKATRSAARHLTIAPPAKGCGCNTKADAEAKRMVVYGDANATDGVNKPLVKGLTMSNVSITRGGGVGSVPGTVKVEIINFKYTPLMPLGKATGDKGWLSVAVKPSTTMRYLITTPSI
ncbi:MAG TPA: TadE family protein [Pyrinomonadaceae bacterium]|jgi:hypothetical protein|nr:TadE family protein [Pyrinomonadaceae bacterium]